MSTQASISAAEGGRAPLWASATLRNGGERIGGTLTRARAGLRIAGLTAVFVLMLALVAVPVHARANAFATADTAGVVVRGSSPAALEAIASHASAHGYDVRASSEDLAALQIDVAATEAVPRAIATMLRAPGVVYAEPLYRARSTDVPADPLFATRQRDYLEPVGAPAAWDIETGSADVVVAVVDTGVDGAHPDLQGRLWVNAGEVPANGDDDDRNGCIDDIHGCAFVSFPGAGCEAREEGAATDDSGHGTFVAGVIAANANNGQGIAGVARGVSVMSVKVLDCLGGGDSFQVARGILYAAENGARIINISLGGPSDPAIVRQAVRAATELGALVVAASGNTGGAGVSYPARYAEVLAVGAATVDDPSERADFSTWGPEVDVAAIGEQVVGTVPQVFCGQLLPCLPGGPYAVGSGTSFAAPQVAGLAALLASRRPGLTPLQIHDIIRATADPVPAGDAPNWAGAGRINMARALQPLFRLGVPGTARN